MHNGIVHSVKESWCGLCQIFLVKKVRIIWRKKNDHIRRPTWKKESSLRFLCAVSWSSSSFCCQDFSFSGHSTLRLWKKHQRSRKLLTALWFYFCTQQNYVLLRNLSIHRAKQIATNYRRNPFFVQPAVSKIHRYRGIQRRKVRWNETAQETVAVYGTVKVKLPCVLHTQQSGFDFMRALC